MIDKTPYTPGLREALKLSKAEAGRLGHDYIGPEHYLLAIIRKGDGLAVEVLVNLDIDLEELRVEIDREAPNGPTEGAFAPNAEGKRTLELAREVANSMKHGWVGTEHLLIALCELEGSLVQRLLQKFGVLPDKVRREARNVIEGSSSGSAALARDAAAFSAASSPRVPPTIFTNPSKEILDLLLADSLIGFPAAGTDAEWLPELAKALRDTCDHQAWAWSGLHRFDIPLLAALSDPDSGAVAALLALGVDVGELLVEIHADLLSTQPKTDLPLTRLAHEPDNPESLRESWRTAARLVGRLGCRAAAQLARELAAKAGQAKPGTEHLLLAAIVSRGVAHRKLEAAGIDFAKAEAAARRVADGRAA